MSDFLYDQKYDRCRQHIEIARQNGWEWEKIGTLGLSAEELDSWLKNQEALSFWPSLGDTSAVRRRRWHEIVAAKRGAAEAAISASRPLVVIGPEETEPGIHVPQDLHTSWQLYKRHLANQDWKESAVTAIETSGLRILRQLRKTTKNRPPVRGLVVGYVQSGKTASMAGLIAMAADHGWNLFIVLSGTLENLRIQTKNRLFKDLNHTGNLHWQVVDHPSKHNGIGQRAQDMKFDAVSKARHLIVSLKNSNRLAGLVDWIEANAGSLSKMKILIIDDEADQGGINTANISKEERTKISGLIIQLSRVKALSVNYVAYTATPAANFLNESPGDALYPEDFIVSLSQSDEHFGPRQIFGALENDHKALGIVRTINNDDLVSMTELHEGTVATLPTSLEHAVIWFLCCAAAMRAYGFRKPVTMLIHTSQRQQHHKHVGEALLSFLQAAAADRTKFMQRCETLWSSIKLDLNIETFADRFPLYGRLPDLVDYPDFNEIRKELPELLNRVSPIKLNDDGELTYHRGVHMCIDNCANNGVNDENEVRRLFYPASDAANVPDFASAFIVIGGSTLARGLTLENLVSTYFLRASTQADSLMQMGRWFGYRRGYELLPRIWMPAETQRKFEFMTLAEEDLRDDLQRFMSAGADPADYGPRVRVHPRASWLKPTAKNRMQESAASDYDFSGVNRQTTVFHDGPDAANIHHRNLTRSNTFLHSLGTNGQPADRGTALVWRDIQFQHISAFLSSFEFHPNAQFFSEIRAFITWYNEHASEAGYSTWNVVVAGTELNEKAGWQLPGGAVGLISRSRVPARSSSGVVSVGVLRDPRDLLADAELAEFPKNKLTNDDVANERKAGNVGNVPQLLLYLIDKGSTPRERRREDGSLPKDATRLPLGAAEHIVGISIWLPSAGETKRQFISHLTVSIPSELTGNEDDLQDTDEQGEDA